MFSRARFKSRLPYARPAVLLASLMLVCPEMVVAGCGGPGMYVQVMGSGSGKLIDGRAATSYLVGQDNKAPALVNIGTGSAMHLARNKDVLAELEVLLLTRVDAIHAGDLPALVEAGVAAGRRLPLPIYGPKGNKFTQSTVSLVRALFDEKRGAFRELGDSLSPLARGTFKLQPHNVSGKDLKKPLVKRRKEEDSTLGLDRSGLTISAFSVSRTVRPGLAWKLKGNGKSVVISGLPNPPSDALAEFARDTDLLILEQVQPDVKQTNLGDAIGRLAYQSAAKQLAIGYRGGADTPPENDTMKAIRGRYNKMVTFIDDNQCLRP